MTIKRVLVPVDFSKDSIEALEVALAYFEEARIYLIYVTDEDKPKSIWPGLVAKEQFSSQTQDEALNRVKDLASEYPAESSRIEPVINVGKPVEAILDAADTHKVDLIVMSSHGDTGVAKTLFGDTTYHVSRKADCSVWVVKGEVPKGKSRKAA